MREGAVLKCNFITVDEAERLNQPLFIDVRSPFEYQDSKIPKAENIPLLDDTERKIVGTIYRQENPHQAKQAGIEIVTPKIPNIVSRLSDLANQHQVLLYCWRGGMRSQSVAQLCSDNNIPVRVLKGGYKSYRRYVNRFWQSTFSASTAVLHGLSGVGKTKILDILASLGAKTINLEEIAANRGSVFGNRSDRSQPSQKDFDALLYETCKYFTKQDTVITECEGRRIGNVHVPKILYQAMSQGIKVHLYADLDIRVHNIVQDYGCLGKDVLIQKISLLTKFMGKKKVLYLNHQIERGNLKEVAYIMLTEYYDPLYGYKSSKDEKYLISLECNDPVKAAHEILDFLQLYSKEVRK